MEGLAQSIQPKERLYSNSYLDLSCKLCTKLSYRNAAEILNLFQHRDAGQTMKLRTLSDCMERVESQISDELEKTTGRVLKMYGLDAQTGLPAEGVCLSPNITDPVIPERTEAEVQAVNSVIDAANTMRDEKIPFAAAELDIEPPLSECVYVSIDDAGVNHQKDSRDLDAAKGAKYVENTVVHIQKGQESYVLTACGMKKQCTACWLFIFLTAC